MAERSGTYIGNESTPKGEALAGAVAASGRPDCLASNANGSLLSVLVIAYQAAKGQCK